MKLRQYIQPKFASDMITLVQSNNKEIVIFDRKGRGEIWKFLSLDDPIFIKQDEILFRHETCMHRAHSYIGKDNVRLILNHDESSKNYMFIVQKIAVVEQPQLSYIIIFYNIR